MDELINRITSSVGIDADLAKQAVGIILNFLNRSAPDDKMEQLLESMPGARDMINDNPGGGGGMFSAGAMGAMGAMNEMTAAGLSMGQVQGVTKETVNYAREQDAEAVDAIVSSIPGLSQFV